MRICSIFLIDKKINGAFCQQLDCGREDYILKMKLSVRTITHDLARSTCFDLLIETKVLALGKRWLGLPRLLLVNVLCLYPSVVVIIRCLLGAFADRSATRCDQS
ncbi:unnamed protein product [Cladocopium goreaui]|uniref:Uncharacterized protein n=1 Tax=Cladocopium goreaui TaxID=2562237 RepID=A0A9P1GFU4_9DINO|nr:unnamed protein product [Cladocopium goreaui]